MEMQDFGTLKTGIKSVESTSGYYSANFLNKSELMQLKNEIRQQYEKILIDYYPELGKKYLKFGMQDYHDWSHLVNHSNIWPKKNRILPRKSVMVLRETLFFKSLEKIFGNIEISNEEQIEEEEIYWRLVRPNEKKDVGPKHADSWFWTCKNSESQSVDFVRLKIWLSILGEPDTSGFVFSPGSHKKNLAFKIERRDGKLKPKPSPDVAGLEFVNLRCPEGSGILFHDSLVHGGEPGFLKTRVSLECTLLIDKKSYFSAMR